MGKAIFRLRSAIHSMHSCATTTYSAEGRLSISCPGRYARQMRRRRSAGKVHQWDLHMKKCGGTSIGHPVQ